MDSSLTAADIALMNRNGDGFGNNSFFWIFALLLLANGGFGFGGARMGDFGQFATSASQNEILFGQKFNALDNKIDKIGYGIADSTYALNNAITTEGRAIQTQLANCCCSNKESIAQVRYDMANFANATQTAIHAEGEATRAMLQQNKIENLQGQINALQMQNAMCGVVRYPMASTYYAGNNPFCNCNCGSL